MIIAKIFSVFLVYLGAISDDAWVSVPKPETVQSDFEVGDSSIWVVFSKEFEGERVLVRFPEDPQYEAKETSFKAWSQDLEGRVFSLHVHKKGKTVSLPKEYGVREKRIESRENLYILRVFEPSESSSYFDDFVSSFHLENEGDFQRG